MNRLPHLLCWFFILFSLNTFAATEGQKQTKTNADVEFTKSKFKLGFLMGSQQYTGNMGKHIDAGFSPGLAISYNLNQIVSFQASFLQTTGDFNISTPTSNPIDGKINYTSIGFHGKAYFGQALKSIEKIDPYIITGFSQNYRTFNLSQIPVAAKDDALAFEAGAGLEFPIINNKLSLGVQALYRVVDYQTENQEFQDDQGNPTGVQLSGDEWTTMFILGLNL